LTPNPFTPFHLALDDSFVDRTAEINTILGRIAKGASSGIVGNPHIGKSSLLRRLSDLDTVATILPNPEAFIFVDLDFQSFVTRDKPDDFWCYVLEEAVRIRPKTDEFFEPLLQEKTFDSRRLLGAFTRLAMTGIRIVLLIDELDYLFNLDHFRTLDFLGPLRVLAMKSGGLVLVTASRLSIAQLNAQTADLKDKVRGSDLFNYLEEVSLGSLPEADTIGWLETHFDDPKAVREIRALAGRHPLLIQLAGEIYFGAGSLPGESARQELQARFIRKAETQFQDVWDYLEPKAQIALVIFVLDRLQDRIASGEEFSLEKAEKYLHWYGAEIGDMLRRGTLEKGADGDPEIGSQAFLAWIAETKIVGTRGDEPREEFTRWLAEKEYKLGGLLTQEEIDWLQKAWKSLPKGLIQAARKALLPERPQ